MSDTPDFLSEEPTSAPETAPEATLEAPEKAPEQPKEQTDPPTAEQPAETPEGVQVEPPAPHHVPLATFLDMRDRLAAAEREAKELAEWRRQQEEKARLQPPPDRNSDPEAFEDWRSQQFVSQLRAQTMNFSRRMAVRDNGQETVDAAYQWGVKRCDEDPLFNQRVLMSDDPYELVVSEWKREQTLSKLGDGDLDAFLAWKAQQAGNPPAPAPQAPVNRAPPAAPRPSLASAPAASKSSAPEGRDGEGTFAAMFEK